MLSVRVRIESVQVDIHLMSEMSKLVSKSMYKCLSLVSELVLEVSELVSKLVSKSTYK